MRIKYKVWDTVEKKWCNNIFVSGCGRVLIGDKHDDCRYVPCIYTGLIDNAGNRIYCGDVLAFPEGDFYAGEDGVDDRMEVFYDKTNARFGLKFFSIHGGEGQTDNHSDVITNYVRCGAIVIGNINSTPNILSE